MNDLEEDYTTETLMFLLDNDHTSASTAGLRKRRGNRQKAIYNMLILLNLTAEEAEDLYWEWQKKKED